MSRLVIPSWHKDWLYPIIKPIQDIPVHPANIQQCLVQNTDSGIWELQDRDLNVNPNYNCKDPRGFWYEGNKHQQIDVYVNETERKQYSYWNMENVYVSCNKCGKYVLSSMYNTEHNNCDICRYQIENINAKSDPGWDKLKKGTAPFFGIELEFCNVNIENAKECINKINRQMITEDNWYIPAFYCRDGSLHGCGIELNFHPIGYDYYCEHKSKFEKMFRLMKEAGCNHLDSTGKEVAGIHIHISNEGSECDSVFDVVTNAYAKLFNDFFVAISGRSKACFNEWCLASYKLFSERNNSDTLEYRGWSTDKLMKDPTSMDFMIRWVKVMYDARESLKTMILTPYELRDKYDPTLDLPAIPINIDEVAVTKFIETVILEYGNYKLNDWREKCNEIFNSSIGMFCRFNQSHVSSEQVFKKDGYCFGILRSKYDNQIAVDLATVNGKFVRASLYMDSSFEFINIFTNEVYSKIPDKPTDDCTPLFTNDEKNKFISLCCPIEVNQPEPVVTVTPSNEEFIVLNTNVTNQFIIPSVPIPTEQYFRNSGNFITSVSSAGQLILS